MDRVAHSGIVARYNCVLAFKHCMFGRISWCCEIENKRVVLDKR